jgi:predicted small secreted protein
MIRNIAICTFIALMLAGCNTVAGVGEDISAGARTVQRAF